MSEINLTEQNFESEVLNSEKPVLVDFWATWCGPCQMIAPIVSEIAEEFSDKIKICKLNVDSVQSIAIEYQISSIPTLALFKDGKIVNKIIGFHSKDEIIKFINI